MWEAGWERSCSAMGTLHCHFHLSCTLSSSASHADVGWAAWPSLLLPLLVTFAALSSAAIQNPLLGYQAGSGDGQRG